MSERIQQRPADKVMTRRILLAIDDTDNLESRGTGHLARRLGQQLTDDGLARVHGISRHQLYVHPDIRYTSHNSSLCLDLDWFGGGLDVLANITHSFLAEHSAPGSDAAYAVMPYDEINEEVMAYALSAKDTVLNQQIARDLAHRAGVLLAGVTGDEGGVIGALAAVGLRKTGNDGRFVWVDGVRDLTGVITYDALLGATGIDVIRPFDGTGPTGAERISVDPWPRPVLINHQAVLLVERVEETNASCDWRIVPREVTKRY